MTPNPQYPGQPAGAPQGTSGLAIAALVCGILGICLPCPLGLVAIGLGIAALVKINKTPGLGGKALAIVGLILPLVGVPIQAAIAIPNFIRFQARAKQQECKSNLAYVFTTQMSYSSQRQAFSPVVEEIGFSPERGNRYAYFLDDGPVIERSEATPVSTPRAVGIGVDTFKFTQARPLTAGELPPLAGDMKVGVHGQCPDCSFVAACAGNIDTDDTLDVWSISSVDRTSARGEVISAGTPFNDVNDLTD